MFISKMQYLVFYFWFNIFVFNSVGLQVGLQVSAACSNYYLKKRNLKFVAN